MRTPLFALGLLLGSAALVAQSPAPSPQQPRRAATGDTATATAIVVDVVVRDRSGKPVTNLTQDDFEVFESGVRQTVGSFRAPTQSAIVEATPVENAPTPTPTAAAASPQKAPAVMAFVFDRLTLESRRLAVTAAERYIGAAAETSNVIGIFDVNLSLRVLQNFTRDGARLRAALQQVSAARESSPGTLLTTDMRGPGGMNGSGLAGGAPGPMDDLGISLVDRMASSRPTVQGNAPPPRVALEIRDRFLDLERNAGGHRSFNGLGAMAYGMGLVPGRKSLVLFSEGLNLTRDNDPHFYALIDQANKANVAVYTVDAVGLRTEQSNVFVGRQLAASTNDGDGNLSSGFSPELLFDSVRQDPAVAMGLLANQTGGFSVSATNNLSKAFGRIDEDLRSYYALTYAPAKAEYNGTFRKIEVKVKKPGLTANTRSGYNAVPPSMNGLTIYSYEAPALARLETAPLPNDFPIRARGLVFPETADAARVPILVSVPASVLDYAADAAAGTFSAQATVLVRLRDANGQVAHKASEQYDFSGKLDKLEPSKAGHILFYRQPMIAPGVYTLEAIVQDARTSKASVRISTVEVPFVGTSPMRLSSLFLVARAEKVEAKRDPSNPLYVGDVLLYPRAGEPLVKAAEKELTFAFTAYVEPGTTPTASVEMLRAGAPIGRVPLTLEAPDASGRIQQVSRLPIEALAPGAYELRVTLEGYGGQRLTRTTPFAIVAGS